MTAATGKRIRTLRTLSLSIAFGVFVALFLSPHRASTPWWIARGLFFAIDPLILLQHLAAAHKILSFSLAGLILVGLTFLFGRFFCGWLCPFGAIHEFVSWIGAVRQKAASRPDLGRLRFKYLILTALLMAALAGTALGGWLDPFTMLSRSWAASLEPAATSYASHSGGTRISTQALLIGVIFFLIVYLNVWRRRFFCNSLCPLGALYGFIARFGLLRFETSSKCTECRACTSRCTYNGGPSLTHLKSECDLCFACVADCLDGSVDLKFGSAGKPEMTLDLGRRHLIGAATAGLTVAAFSRANLEARPLNRNSRGFLRPPGALEERLFLSRCLRCGQCVEACPTNFIQPSLLETGFAGLWTPVLIAKAGYCVYECNLCTKSCPSGAIAPLTLMIKKSFKVGTATINRNRCLREVEGGDCRLCVEKCPVPGKPLREEPRQESVHGRVGVVRPLYVVADLCTGCGICEHFCPTGAARGITVGAEQEDREAAPVG